MATATFTLTISSAPATAVTLIPVAGLAAPVAVGTKLADISVAPAGWIGAVSASDANGNAIPGVGIGGTAPNYTVVATASLPAESIPVKVTALP